MTKNHQPSPLLYLSIIIGTFVLLCCSAWSAYWHMFEHKTAKYVSLSSAFISAIDTVQTLAKDRMPGNAVCIIGGSGSLYSVSTEMLSQRLKRPVVNLALHAGLGIQYLLYRAKKHLRPGDVAVVLLEPHLYASPQESWTLADWIIPSDFRYFSGLSFRSMYKLIALLTLNEHLDRFTSPRQAVDAAKDVRLHVNSFGDVVGFFDASRPEHARTSLAANAATPLKYSMSGTNRETQDWQPSVIEFVQWAKANNILVLAGAPALLDAPLYHTPNGSAFFKDIEAMWTTLDIPFINSQVDFLFPIELFYDTRYHMNDAGRLILSRKLSEVLASWLPLERLPAYEFPKNVSFALGDDIFTALPPRLTNVEGLSLGENWGAWTVGPKMILHFSMNVPQALTLTFHVTKVFPQNLQGPIRVKSGGDVQELAISAPGTYTVMMRPQTPVRELTVSIPTTHTPQSLGLGEDTRLLGLGLSKIDMQFSE